MEAETSNASNVAKFKTIAVFCGSSVGKGDCYKNAAVELAQEMVTRRFNLVYGGGSIGLMGVVSQIVHQGGCNVLGIIPSTLLSSNIIGTMTGHVKPVIDMHQRKTKMMRESDCFIALPGGYGTLEELFEVISWAQLGVHVKPVGLLNVNGYYNHLLSMIDKAVQDEFIKPFDRNILVTASTVKELINKLESYVPVPRGVIGSIPSQVVEEDEKMEMLLDLVLALSESVKELQEKIEKPSVDGRIG